MPLAFLPLSSRARHRRSYLVRRLVAVAVTAVLSAGIATAAFGAAQATDSVAWGGYTNGNIPTSAMTAIPNGYVRSDAAAGYFAMAAAFKATFHENLAVTEGYRPYATQVALFQARYTVSPTPTAIKWNNQYWVQNPGTSVAAIPGTSVHGWALAIDFGSNVNNASSPEKKWADANGPTYGWYPKGNAFGEPWHFEFTPVKGTTTTTAAKPTPVAKPTPAPVATPKPTATVAAAPKATPRPTHRVLTPPAVAFQKNQKAQAVLK